MLFTHNNKGNDVTENFLHSLATNQKEPIETFEEHPVFLSKNNGNRFIAFIFDRALALISKKDNEINLWDLHEKRIRLTQDHILFCRKKNLFNNTFNADSMTDILWSHQILSSDNKRTIGHVLCLESTALHHILNTLMKDPIIQNLTNGDLSQIPIYRWRQFRDVMLRQDDGRNGIPTLLLAMDRQKPNYLQDGHYKANPFRQNIYYKHLEYLIQSKRVIASGPLHLPTSFKNDSSSVPVGDLTLFNSISREDAIQFAEQDPYALVGLYETMKVHRYNKLDVTGKFLTNDPFVEIKDIPTLDIKDAMDYWGYPINDKQTPWINW